MTPIYDPPSLSVDLSSGPTAPASTAAPRDLVSDLLQGLRLVGVQYRSLALADGSGIAFTNRPGRAQFHFVGHGPVWLRSASGAVHALVTGDAVFLPHGGPHALMSSPDVAPRRLLRIDAVRDADEGPAVPASGPAPARLFSACMAFDLGGMQPLVAAMPEVMQVATLLTRHPEIVPMLEAMGRESRGGLPGHVGMLGRLADVVAALIVRGWVQGGGTEAGGWAAALHDPGLGRAIAGMHRDPARRWSVASLADTAGISRSVFAERFVAATGQSPLRYLTALRMRLAVRSLACDRQSADEVAWRSGYGSLAAFSRAFKREVGRTPGAVRAGGVAAD